MRIVSLISSGTEILCELGLAGDLVGISHECDFPDAIRGLPVLSRPNLDPTKGGAEIDRDVRALVRDGLSVYSIDTEKLAALEPDLIVTQDQCAVCAVSLKDVEDAVCRLTLKKTRICSLVPNSLADIEEDFRRVGRETGTLDRAEALVARFRARLGAVEERVSTATRLPRIACLEWLEPPIVAGGWMPEIARLAGTIPILVGEPGPFRKIEWDELLSMNPDVVAILPCGYPIEKTLKELVRRGPLEELIRIPAVRAAECYVLDGNAYFNRPGPRIADSCEILAAIAHPGLCAEYRDRHARSFTPWTVA